MIHEDNLNSLALVCTQNVKWPKRLILDPHKKYSNGLRYYGMNKRAKNTFGIDEHGI